MHKGGDLNAQEWRLECRIVESLMHRDGLEYRRVET